MRVAMCGVVCALGWVCGGRGRRRRLDASLTVLVDGHRHGGWSTWLVCAWWAGYVMIMFGLQHAARVLRVYLLCAAAGGGEACGA